MTATTTAVRRRELKVEDLTGIQRAAVFLLAVGTEHAAKITSLLTPEEVERITLEIARIEYVPTEVAEAVLDEWRETERAAHTLAQGGVESARRILEAALGPERAAEVLERIEQELRETEGFRNLRLADPQQIASVLGKEYPQTIALILAHLNTGVVADVVKFLDPELGSEALLRLARMEKVHPDVLQVVDRSLSLETALSITQDMRVAGGPAAVAAVLNLLPGSLEKELLSGIDRQDSELCEEVKGLMFVFEDIKTLDERALQRILGDIETRELALALKVASEELKEKIRATMSQRAIHTLDQEIEFLGPVRLRDVEAAQAAIVERVRELEEQGEITISGGGDDIIV